MGAVAVDVRGTFNLGGSRRAYLGKATLSTSYAAGGDTVAPTPGDQGFEFALFSPAGGYVLQFDQANRKLKASCQNAAAGPLVEVAPGTNLSAVTADFLAIGL